MEPFSMEPVGGIGTNVVPFALNGRNDEDSYLATLNASEYEAVMRYKNSFQTKEEMESFVNGLRG